MRARPTSPRPTSPRPTSPPPTSPSEPSESRPASRPLRRTLRRALLTGLATLTALSLAAAPWASAADPGRAPDGEVITDWNLTAVQVIAGDAARPTAEPFLWYGFVSAAVYNAVVGIEGRYTAYKWNVRGPRHASSEAAAATAARRVLLTYFPASRKRIEAAYADSLANIPDGTAEEQGVRFGERAAARIVELREDDGRDSRVTFDPAPGPGVWQPAPPDHRPAQLPWLAEVRPMLFDSPDRFVPGPPPALTSETYTRDLAEVKSVGAKDSVTRTAWQTETARFFSHPLPQQLQAGYRDHAERHGLDIVEAARYFAAANTASADATITTWNSKFGYAFWRPVTAVRQADTDGNPATEADPDWLPLLNTPPYPEYMGGHCANDGAVMAVLDRLTGGDIDLRLSSTPSGTTRTYTDSADYMRDVIDARVWSGIHFRTADLVGSRVGRDIGNWALDHYFRPLR